MEQQNQIDNQKLIDLTLKLSIDMDNLEVETAKVEAKEGQKSFREKVLTFLKNQVANRKEEWDGYKKTSLADSELSPEFKHNRTIAEVKYWQAVDMLNYVELL